MNPVYASFFIFPLLLGTFVYLFCTIHAGRLGKKWPGSRFIFLVFGVLFAICSVTGPLPDLAHADFRIHMVTHLFLGMLSPLLIHFSHPLTLILRTLSVQKARKLTRFFKSRYVRTISHPVNASLLNIGGLWLLYTTHLYEMMHQHELLLVLVHIHIFLVGYVYTASILQLEPSPVRYRFSFRSAVLVLSLAAHQILAKYLYAHPPDGVPLDQAEAGGMLMYYGGDAIDLVMIITLCRKWHKTMQPRGPLHAIPGYRTSIKETES